MKIEFLKKLEKYPPKDIEDSLLSGISEQQIQDYEEKLNLHFPKAYREYLFLAGDCSGALTLLEGTSSIKDFADEGFQEYFKKNYLELFNFNETRPFWVFSTGSQAFFFFYLDEENDDPEVWKVEFYELGSYELSKIDDGSKFSKFINEVVDYSIENYRMMYGN